MEECSEDPTGRSLPGSEAIVAALYPEERELPLQVKRYLACNCLNHNTPNFIEQTTCAGRQLI
jgi:hypothetical protein